MSDDWRVRLRDLALYAAIGLLLGLFFAILTVTPPMRRLEERLGDRRLVLWRQLSEGTPNDIVLIPIDDDALRGMHLTWPLPRGAYAQLVENLRRGGAKAIGITDFLETAGPDASQDAALANALRGHDDVVLASRLDLQNSTPRLLTPFFECISGFVDAVPSADSVVRRFLVTPAGVGQKPNCMALELARRYYQDIDFVPLGFAGPPGTTYLISYPAGPGQAFPVVALSRALGGADLSSKCKGKIVLIGSMLEHPEDELRTPFALRGTNPPDPPLSTLELQADVLFTMLGREHASGQREALLTLTALANLVLIAGLIFISFQIFIRVNFVFGAVVAGFLLFMYTLGSWYALIFHHRWLPLLGPLLAVVVSYGVALTINAMRSLWKVSQDTSATLNRYLGR
jgi:CHASE2 domain-containing sensor protein